MRRKIIPGCDIDSVFELNSDDVQKVLPVRRSDDHKGKRGGVLVAAGSARYRGAALLAARGALRMGAGIVVVASVEEVLTPLSLSLPEAIMERLDAPEDLDDIFDRWRERCSVLLVGPGLDRDERARGICRRAARWSGPSVWDGDGLYWLAEEKLHPSQCCVTPHFGEAQRLIGLPLGDHRFANAQTLAELYGAAVLKGPRSVVAQKNSPLWDVPRGDRTLSIPGSGDVLAGACAAMCAAGLGFQEALAVAVWCHGAAGERIGRLQGKDGALAHEVADMLPLVLKELVNRANHSKL